jgi:hypothetical protein
MNRYFTTLKQLLQQPGSVINSRLSDEPSDYLNPFLFLLSGAVLVTILNTILVDFSFEPVVSDVAGEDDQLQEIASWILMSNVRASTQFLPLSASFLLVPMLALSGLFFFRDYFTGFYSMLVLNGYAIGATMIFQLLLIPVWIFSGLPLTDPLVNSTLPAVVLAITAMWIYKACIPDASFIAWVRIISTFIVGYVFYTILNGFAAGIIGYLIYAVLRISELSGAM